MPSPTNVPVSAATAADLQEYSSWFAEFKTKTEQHIQELQVTINRHGQELQNQDRLPHKYVSMGIKTLKEDGRKAICKVIKADYSRARDHWASFLQSLSQEDTEMLKEHGFTEQAIKATACAKFQQQDGPTPQSCTPDVVAAAVANLPESAKKAHVLLFDAIHGAGSFEKEEEQAWDV